MFVFFSVVSLVNTCDKFTNVIDVNHIYHVSKFVARVYKADSDSAGKQRT